jgi:hypothetical protein
MASEAEIQALRELAPLPAEGDEVLGSLFDALGQNGALAHLWEKQAVKTASLVDVSESGSSRKMSQTHTQALALATRYLGHAESENPTATSGRAGTRLISR